MTLPEKIKETTLYLRSHGIDSVHCAIILGTGLGSKFIDSLEDNLVLDYGDIPHFNESTVEFHHGKLIYGKIAGKDVLAFQGRYHFYEGYDLEQVTYPVRICKSLGANYLLISNAAGGMNLNWDLGDLMLIDDHINLQPFNPLIGKNFEELGPRFPDMSQPYNSELNKNLKELAKKLNINLREGVYAGVTGPQLETRAEYRYLRSIGADVVGMSTIPEVIVANHAAIPCCAISVLTDMCDPDNLQPINIEDIIDTAGISEPILTKLYIELIKTYL